MSFLTPLALGLGAIAGPIIILYMLRLRRRDVQVSSTMLWQQLLRDREANAPWQKLRRNLLLFLQLLILAALVFALARPYVEVPTVTSGRIAMLIDASASMNSTDVLPNRFEVAKQQAANIVDTLGGQDTVSVIRVAEVPEVALNYSNNRTELRNVIGTLKVGTGSADWNAALTLAAAGASGADKFTILIVGDGGLSGSLATDYGGEVRFVPVGVSESNLAISALSAATNPGKKDATQTDTTEVQIYARITNFGSQNASTIFSVKLDDKLYKADNYTVPANSYTDVIVPVQLGGSSTIKDFRRVEADLTRPAASTVPDFLPLDDTAYAVYSSASAGKALLVMGQNRFLEQAFASLTDWQAFRADPAKPLPTEPYDLYVFDGSLPANLPDANLLLINPSGNTSLFKVGPALKDVGELAVRRDDPRTRFLKFNDVNFREYKPITDASWADALLTGTGGPLIIAGEYKGRRIAVLGFDLRDSDLPLKIAWPILLANLTDWYKAPRAVNINGSLRPGQAVSIRPGLQANVVRVQRPDGATTTLNVDQPSLIYADTPIPGIYAVDVYQGNTVVQSELFAVNTFDENESRISVRTPALGNTPVRAGDKSEIGQREYWPWIALVGLGLLVIEWYVYHRRQQLPALGRARVGRFARRA